ncbi:MAG: OmpA/MotB family protein [Planctomycetota bacterium]
MAESSAPEWIVTFSDIVSLLVTFFIMILTWSTLETEQFELIAGSLKGAMGVVGRTTDRSSMVRRPQLLSQRDEHQGVEDPPEVRATANPFEDMAVRLKHELGEAIDFERIRTGHRIRLTAGTLFAPGSAQLSARCRRGLDAVAQALALRYNPIRVEGHTDAHFEPTADYPTAWALSVARAVAAARYLADHGIAPERISVAGYGDHRPAVRGDSPARQARNRRVEIVVLQVPKDGN